MASDIKGSAKAMLHHATGFQASQTVKRLSSMCECNTFGGNAVTPLKLTTQKATGCFWLAQTAYAEETPKIPQTQLPAICHSCTYNHRLRRDEEDWEDPQT